MTLPNDPYFHERPQRPPSWVLPISVAAAVTFLVGFSEMFAGGVLGCCCCMEALLPGAAAGFIARDRDQTINAGSGFTVGLIGVGAGAVAYAAVMVLMLSNTEVRDELESAFRELFEKARSSQPDFPLSGADASSVVEWIPYFMLLVAVVVTLVGGLGGMIGSSLGARRAAPPAEE